eukprot:tig00000912_g5436.t1
MARRSLKAVVIMSLTAGAFVASPQIAAGTINSAVRLCLLAEEPFLQKSGASRLSTIAYFDTNKTKIVEEGGLFALARLLGTHDDDVQLAAAEVLVTLAEYPDSGRLMGESEVLQPLVSIAGSPGHAARPAAARALAALAAHETNREPLLKAGAAAALRKAAGEGDVALRAAADLLAPQSPKGKR